MRKKKRKAAYRSKQKANVKRNAQSHPKVLRSDNIRRFMTPLWITSAVFLAVAGLVATLLPPAKYIALWVAFFGVLLSVAAVFVWFHALIAEHDRLPPPPAHPSPTTSVDSSKRKSRFRSNPDTMEVAVGHNRFRFSNNGPPMALLAWVRSDGSSLLTASLRDGKFFVQAFLLGGVIRLEGDELSRLPAGAGWDWNSDESSIEIVDEKEAPIFQMEYKDDRLVVIRGVFADSQGSAIVNDTTIIAGSNPVPDPAAIAQSQLAPMFKYPRWKYFGERR